MASIVDDIALYRGDANDIRGVGVSRKLYVHEGAEVTRAVLSQLAAVPRGLKVHAPKITPLCVMRYARPTYPSFSSASPATPCPTRSSTIWSSRNTIRAGPGCRHGAEVPYPYGGKPSG